MAMGIGSMRGLEHPSTTGEPLCEGPSPLTRSELGAMCLILDNGPEYCPFGGGIYPRSGTEQER